MTLLSFSCRDFRCLAEAAMELDPRYNLIHGANASGKTSVLEAIAYLGRGKSFRSAPPERLVRHGAGEFLLLGRVGRGGREMGVGVRNGRGGLEISVDGDRSGGVAELAELLPLQIVDPEVHNLVAGGPEQRRRYLDWIAFHVEPSFLQAWRRFRRALKQRNAALRDAAPPAELAGWDREFLDSAQLIHEVRGRCLALAEPVLRETAEQLLGGGIAFEYQQGWPADQELPDALAAGRERDLQLGTSRSGPQRADLRLSYDDRQARKLVSRGQQKLLACTLVVSATKVVQQHLRRPLLLLLDDPAAELDATSLARLMNAVGTLGAQVIATALEPDQPLFPTSPRRFHVEHGELRRLN
ncbi:MAG TPA: DNA replication/repair protein RecF [Woeseiaceae bacterium]|nr:DNA replication/repair protein RecF [Woeseiaceae bacterium]